MRILLIRHGETRMQEERRYQGITDLPLSPAGREKLIRARECPGRVFVSPLLRARETARILFPDAEQTVVRDLSEMDFGVFEGKTAKEMEQDPLYREWVDGMCLGTCPGGESKEAYCARVCEAFSGILSRAQEEGETSLVIVAHGGTQMAVMERFCGGREYYGWQLGCGQGYVLEADNWKMDRSLRIQGTVSFVRI